MAKQVQWRKGTTDQHKSFVGANCEITVDTTKKTLVVHDGITPGGSVQATEKYVNDAVATIDVSNYPSKDYVDGLDGQNVKITGNQTISDVKTFSSDIVGNITGNSQTATKLATARTITMSGGVSGSTSFDGSNNVTISANVNDNSHNHTSLSGTVRFNGSTGNEYHTSNITVEGNGTADTIKATIGFHQSGLYAGTLSMLDPVTFQFKKQDGSPATLMNNITGNSGTATRANTLNISGNSATFNWLGQGGQPTWLYGCNDPSNVYAYNPSNFSVNYANSAGYAATVAAATPTSVGGIKARLDGTTLYITTNGANA